METELSTINNSPQADYKKIIWKFFKQYKKSESSQPNITALHPEILVKIFSYLNITDLRSIPRVCKSWREASYSKCLWHNIEVRLDSEERNSALFTSLAQRGIKKLHNRYIEKHLPELVVVLPKLELLNLGAHPKFYDNSRNLVSLNLSDCKHLTDKSISQIALHCKNLSKLLLDNCHNVTDCSLMLIAWGLKKLKVLSLCACNDITDLGIKHIVGHGCNPLSDGNRLLECLELEECTRISNVALRYLSEGFMKHLETINLNYCIQIDNVGLKYLSKISSLRELRLRGCPKITNVGVKYMIEVGCLVDRVDILRFVRVDTGEGTVQRWVDISR